MKKPNTTLIVGAGASTEFDLPAGTELKQHIAQLLDFRFERGITESGGDISILESLKQAIYQDVLPVSDANRHHHVSWRIRDAMPQAISIDNFVDAHRGNRHVELCSKLAIVRAILNAEKRSCLYSPLKGDSQKIDFEQLQSTWLNGFFQLLTENCRVSQLEQRFSALTLIVFNYDRCIQHFIFHALQNYYGISSKQSADLTNRIAIFHPYGSVGLLSWQAHDGVVGFGAEPSAETLLELAQQIRTFTEGTDPTQSKINDIRNRLHCSETVIFLGFAYHKLNLKLLFADSGVIPRPDNARYFGTAFGLSSSDCAEIQDELSALAGLQRRQILIRRDLTCANLFGEYWRSLSFAKSVSE